MKKLTIFFCFFLALQVQAQTKEETITWIKEKIIKYKKDYEILSINACEIKLRYHKIEDGEWIMIGTKYRKTYFEVTAIYTLPTDNCKVYEEKYVDFGKFVKQQRTQVYKYIWNDGREVDIDSYNNKESISYYYTDFNFEADLPQRMVKAINHLSTYCEKKKETF